MTKLYVFDLKDKSHVATITADGEEACEKAFFQDYNIIDHGSTYSPDFGAAGGLKENPDAIQHIEG